jgi:hypothetical protein
MLQRHTRLVAATAALLVSMASAASAQITLWDQSNWAPSIQGSYEGSLNHNANSCSQISGNTKLHTANDVHFNQPVHITSVSIYELTGNVDAATLAYLWISPKTGPMPTAAITDVAILANQVPITVVNDPSGPGNVRIVTAANLNINLPAGDYWVSLTPRHNRGSLFPYTVHLVTSGPVIGDPTPSLLGCVAPGTWSIVLPTPYDYAFKVMGDFPVATAAASWAKVKSYYR